MGQDGDGSDIVRLFSANLVTEELLPLADYYGNRGGSEVFICNIRNVLSDEMLTDDKVGVGERLKLAAPVITTHATYFNLSGTELGAWGEPGARFK